jgi:DNA-binding Lrp family transcriptional regulator
MHYLSQYQTFNSKEELNTAIYAHIKRNSYDLNETDRKALKMIARYAVKFAGAAHLKAATIAELIGKSEKTARRVINKLESLGIVRKVATMRKINGGKGANILQILPVEDGNDQSTLSSREDAKTRDIKRTESQKSAAEPSNSIKQLKNNTFLETATVPSTALKESLPSAIYDAMSPYFNAEELYRYYGILLRAKRSVSNNVLIEDNPQPFVAAFQNAILKLKQRKIRNLANYLYRAWQSATATIVRRRVFENNDLFYDWLADA